MEKLGTLEQSFFIEPQENFIENFPENVKSLSHVENGVLFYDLKNLEDVLTPVQKQMSKTVAFLGKTGSGKTTMINAAANHLLGIKFEDKYRYILAKEPVSASQLKSLTEKVNKYYFYSPVYKKMMCLIDTPGFADTGKEDEKNTRYGHGHVPEPKLRTCHTTAPA